MEKERILVPESLQETLWRLEEVRQGFRTGSDAHVKEALDWVLSRQGLKGSYRGLFAPTDQDCVQGVRLLTGECLGSYGSTRHILGEEALRTAIAWNLRSSPAVTKALMGFSQILEDASRPERSGFYCCHKCTAAFLRTLAAAKPDNWDRILEQGVDKIREARTSDGRWHGFPFYYTLLTLSEIGIPSSTMELRYARKVAERLLGRYQKEDRTSRFRKLALESTLSVF